MAPVSNPSASTPPCAACKLLRRKCLPDCIFAPYFSPDYPQKFANVHKIFGASNIAKLLNDLLPHQREDAANSLAYEAEARMKDPVYGCVGAISVLQKQVQQLQNELDAVNANLLWYACNEIPTAVIGQTSFMDGGGRGGGGGAAGAFYHNGNMLTFPYAPPPWNSNNISGDSYHGREGESSM